MAAPPVTAEQSTSYDVSIGGIPFTANWSADVPLNRESAQMQKNQFDTAPAAGEQTLDFWWLRSQTSWHGGAGQEWFEPAQEEDDKFARVRFDSSFNLDVWTHGQFTRLPDTRLDVPFTETPIAVLVCDAADNSYVAVAHGSTLSGRRLQGVESSFTYNWGGTNAIVSACTDGLNYYVTDGTTIYTGRLDDPTGTGTPAWTISESGADVKLGWSKQRLVACVNNVVYEVTETANAASPPPLATVRYTHPSIDWRWGAFGDGPSGVLIAGSSGSVSSIYQFGLADTNPPVMGGATIIATMPTGEYVTSLTAYIGSFLGIGTSAGVRVGAFNPYWGSLQYGPVSYKSSSPVLSVTGKSNYLYAAVTDGVENESGLVRLDLGMQIDSFGRIAWANDLVTDTAGTTGNCTHVAPVQWGTRMVFAVEGSGLWIERVPDHVTVGRPGWLRTSKVRYTTIEPKFFRFLSVRGITEPGLLEVFATFTGDSEAEVLNWPNMAAPTDFKLSEAPREWAQLRLQISGDPDRDLTVNSWRIKSVPAIQRQEMMAIPVNILDAEQDRNGNRIGHAGWGRERFLALKRIENSGVETTVSFDNGDGTSDSYRCYIDKVQFQQSTNPKKASTFGGLAVITVRTIT